ncbi:MAG: protein kinase [Sandaracinaceae bacterium]|nr:protein kinase [Sandaracinaceae bacterium]
MKSEPRYVEATPASTIDRRYSVRREIARGGMGIVFEAEHTLTRSPVAIKVLTTAALGWPIVHARLMREARALAVARHPNVASVLDAGVCRSHGPYLVLEMIEGRTLESFVVARNMLDIESTVSVAHQVAAALDHVHAVGVVHRDVKPGNILVTRSPGREGDVLKLLDFGIARVGEGDDVVDRKLTQQTDVLGTIEYMAPEQILDGLPPTASTDVYALGVSLYECLVGDVPFPGTMTQVMSALLAGKPVPSIRAARPDVPPALEAAILRAMRRDPAQRYGTATELAAACTHALGRLPGTLNLLDPRPAPTESTRRQFTRAPYVTPVRVLGTAGPCDGRTEDVSEGGLLVVTSGVCLEGDRVSVRLPLPSSGRVVTLDAIARWAKTQRGQRAIGVEFTDLPSDARSDIRNYVALMASASQSLRPQPPPATAAPTVTVAAAPQVST